MAVLNRASAREVESPLRESEVKNFDYGALAQREAFAKIQEQANQQAQDYYRSWREKDFESVRKEQSEIAQREANARLERWKNEYEESIGKEAIKKSQNVITGKVTEQLIPYLPNFRYNPKDARFIGSPVDFLVFDGMDEGVIKQVVFIEVKTGTSSLSTRQRQVRGIIDARKIKWEELRVDHGRMTHTSPKPSQTLPSRVEASPPSRAYSTAGSYEVGETISHDTFGSGRVIAVNHNRIEVQFSRSIKTLVHRSKMNLLAASCEVSQEAEGMEPQQAAGNSTTS